jgi:hypothetical protein
MNYYFAPTFPANSHLAFLLNYEILETEKFSPDIGRGALRAKVKTLERIQ